MSKLYEKITAENWVKGVGRTSTGRRCLTVHAHDEYWAADAHEHMRAEAWARIGEAIRMLYPDRAGKGIPFFNDHPDTTLDDVIRVCKVADV